jgi:protein-tyrosine-phosphatase
VKANFSVLFVCSGNTCRSPLAERILKDRIMRKGWKGISVSSAGTGAASGAKASAGARQAARELGVSMAGFRSKPLTGRRVARADLILTMTHQHREEIGIRWPDALERTHMISDYTDSGREGIVDPIGQPDEAYTECAAELSDEISRMLPKLRRAAPVR